MEGRILQQTSLQYTRAQTSRFSHHMNPAFVEQHYTNMNN